MNRHARQERVIGSAAQARVGQATVRVQSTSSPAASVEARYLAGAGVAGLYGENASALEDAHALDSAVAVHPDPIAEGAPGPEEPQWTGALTPAARAFVLGALRALATIRAASR